VNKPMHKMSPQEHAALGWGWGSYRDGTCISLLSSTSDKESRREFYIQASEDDAEVIDLMKIRALPDGDVHER